MITKAVLTLTGPSCSGKTSIEKELEKFFRFHRAVSTTTRKPRPGDLPGAYYHVEPKTFERMLASGEFVEHVQFGGEHYGLTIDEFERGFDQGKPVIVVAEPIGTKQVRDHCHKNDWMVRSIFIDVQPQVMFRRFLDRSEGMTKDAVAARLALMATVERSWLAQAYTDTTGPSARYDAILHNDMDKGVFHVAAECHRLFVNAMQEHVEARRIA